MRVLLVTTRWPWPTRRGNQLRAAQWIEALVAEHEVTLVAPRRAADLEAPEHARLRVVATRVEGGRALFGVVQAILAGRAAQNGLYRSRSLARAIRAETPRHDLTIAQLVRLEGYLADLASGVPPLAVDLIDSLSLNFARRAQVDAWWKAPALAFEARRLAQAEERFLARCELASVVCPRDLDDLARRSPTRLSSRLRVVELALPLAPPKSAEERPTDRPPVLVLSGNLGYFPTAEGARWWLRSVWPALRSAHPDLICRFAGARPGRALSSEARRAGIDVVVDPPDLRALVRSADLALAPARAGSGVPVKVLEAWAEGVPVVASSWTAAGVSGRHDHDLWIADSVADWTVAITRLLAEPQTRDRIAQSGRERVARENAPAVVGGRIREFAEEAVRRRVR